MAKLSGQRHDLATCALLFCFLAVGFGLVFLIGYICKTLGWIGPNLTGLPDGMPVWIGLVALLLAPLGLASPFIVGLWAGVFACCFILTAEEMRVFLSIKFGDQPGLGIKPMRKITEWTNAPYEWLTTWYYGEPIHITYGRVFYSS